MNMRVYQIISALILFILAGLALGATTHKTPVAAQCTDPVVWEFVADMAARFPACKTLIGTGALADKTCAQVEMAQLQSGCVAPDTPLWRPAHSELKSVDDISTSGKHPCRAKDGLNANSRVHFIEENKALHLGCRASKQTCPRSTECAKWGQCSGPQHDQLNCYVGSDADCAQSQRCQQQNSCVAGLGRCLTACSRKDALKGVELPLREISYLRIGVACMPYAGEKDCAKTKACALYGLCSNQSGFCVADSDAACRRAQTCSEWGGCIALETGECGAAMDVDCRQSRACKEDGRCQVERGECVRAADAKKVPRTVPAVRVKVDGEYFYPPDFDCTTSKECLEDGACERYIDQNCDQEGHCSDKFAVCVHSDTYCRAQPACAEQGKCVGKKRILYKEHRCSYTKVRRPREALKPHKRLVAPSCAWYIYGGCTITKATCQASKGCTQSGACSVAPSSTLCRPTTQAHCAASRDCRDYGHCDLFPQSTYQICGATRAGHCEASTQCKKAGQCALSAGGVCEAALPEHCENSTGCKEDGACTLVKGRCA